MLDKIFFLDLCPGCASAAAFLFTVGTHWQALDISAVANGYYHILFGNQVFYFQLLDLSYDIGPALVTVFFLQALQLFFNDTFDFLFRGQDRLA